MAGKVGRPKKGKFDDVPSEFKEAVESESAAQIDQRILAAVKETEEILKAKDDDEDLKEKQAAYREAGAVYKEGVKALRLKQQYCLFIKESRGS